MGGIDDVPGKFQPISYFLVTVTTTYIQWKSPVVNEHPEVDGKCKKAWRDERW